MHRCPKCGSYMTFKILWIAGNPVCMWECICGYKEAA